MLVKIILKSHHNLTRKILLNNIENTVTEMLNLSYLLYFTPFFLFVFSILLSLYMNDLSILNYI